MAAGPRKPVTHVSPASQQTCDARRAVRVAVAGRGENMGGKRGNLRLTEGGCALAAAYHTESLSLYVVVGCRLGRFAIPLSMRVIFKLAYEVLIM